MSLRTQAAARPRRVTENKEERILDEACRLFAEKGFDGTSIRDIAGAVGISNAALYHYFPDKNALFGRIFIVVTERLCNFVEAHLDPGQPAPARLRAFMRGYASFFEQHAFECIAASLSFRALEASEHRTQAIFWRDRYEKMLRDILRDGVANGEFRDNDISLTGKAVLSCLNWLHRWYSPKGRLTPVEIVEHYADIILGGIAASPVPGPERRHGV